VGVPRLELDFESGKAAMINRRRVLQSCLSFAAASGASRGGSLFGSLRLPYGSFLQPCISAADESGQPLAEMLRDAIELCRKITLVPHESRRLCEIALVRVQRSDEMSPAFWQACADSVGRLETAISECGHANSLAECPRADVLYQLHRLRAHLITQTVQVIGRVGRRT